MKPLYPWPYPKLVAHRGAGRLAPENTLSAMRLGAGFGYQMFEFDVKLTQDQVAVLLHDATLDRTTSGTGPAHQMTYAQVALLDAGQWHSKQYAGEAIPTLKNVSNYLIANHLACNIEIKPSPGFETLTGALVAQQAARDWEAVSLTPLLSSFSRDALEAAKRASPHLPRGFLSRELPEDWLEILTTLECVSVHLDHESVVPSTVKLIRDAGFRLCVWTVNDLSRVHQLLDWGVDTVITDRVDLIKPL